MSAPAQIFKAYDIRGLYGDEIDGDIAEQIGRAFVRVLASMHGKDAADLRVGLGRDMRLQAPEMAGRYRDGMVSEGAHVLDAQPRALAQLDGVAQREPAQVRGVVDALGPSRP